MPDSYHIDFPSNLATVFPCRFFVNIGGRTYEINATVFDMDTSKIVSVFFDSYAFTDNPSCWQEYTYSDVVVLVIGAVVKFFSDTGWRLVSHSTTQPNDNDECYLITFVFHRVRRRVKK